MTATTFTTTQAAALLHVSAQTIRDWTAAGKLPATTSTGGHRRYHLKDIYLAHHNAHGHDRYWLDDACLIMDPAGNITIRYADDAADKYNNKPLATADTALLQTLAEHGQQILFTPKDLHIEGDNVTVYLQARALTKAVARQALRDNIDTTRAWLQANAKPVTTTVTIWQTQAGEPITAW